MPAKVRDSRRIDAAPKSRKIQVHDHEALRQEDAAGNLTGNDRDSLDRGHHRSLRGIAPSHDDPATT